MLWTATTGILASALLYHCWHLPEVYRLDRIAISEQNWKGSVSRRMEYMSGMKNESLVLFPNPKDGTWKQRQLPYTAWDFFPPAYGCPFEMERVGSFGDGGKWICGISQYAAFKERPIVVYSFGVDEDSSFEAELVDRTSAHVYAFDYSVDNMGPEITNGSKVNVKFSKIGLGGSDETVDGNRFMTLPSIMSELGHDYVDILKMDVEGAEFDALDVLMETYNGSSLPFGQLMIEFHLWAAPQNIRDLVAWWERLESFGLRPVAQESNPLGVILGPGYPCCYEYVLINTRDNKSILQL
ncbi:hypothetical protein HBI56_044930 [Parastagonospora nodorum]|nr:hypothetical protein HBH56_058050 [Parastagonospora nodorum]KAH3931010.1 hypothetical protein HBH54_101980 [Parastagonospora nodorum]KAH3943779.1 hypothetical protein HBH53_167850 [Parastagonospora nodorum]KAH3965385.1 hypothetical protein HBH51_150560 [Parastagonospora nodorum]KAH3977565.1 hypothetical protein HBH52_111080 [Parastagonospora nodorum]